MKRLTLLVILILFTTAFLHPDIYIREKIKTEAYQLLNQSQPVKVEYSEQWIGEDVFTQNLFSINTDNQQRQLKVLKKGIIIDFIKNKLFIINHIDKTFVRAELPLVVSRVIPAEAQQNLSTIKMNTRVTPNGQNKKIGNWNCSGYDIYITITAMTEIKLKMSTWASTEIPLDWKSYQDKILPIFKKASALQLPISDDDIDELKKIQGFQISSDITSMLLDKEIKMEMSLIEMTEKNPPENIYSVPEGYTEKKELSRMDLMNK